MSRRAALLAVLSLVCLVALPGSALAVTTPRQGTDPNANSPAGVIYSIPLDNARQNASPHNPGAGTTGGGGSGGGHSGGAGGGTAGSGGSGSATSQRARGGAAPVGVSATSSSGSAPSGSSGSGGSTPASSRQATTGSAVLVPGGQPGSLIHSGNGFGSSSLVPGVNAPLAPGFQAVDSNASSAPTLAVVVACVVLALGAITGVGAWRHSSQSG